MPARRKASRTRPAPHSPGAPAPAGLRQAAFLAFAALGMLGAALAAFFFWSLSHRGSSPTAQSPPAPVRLDVTINLPTTAAAVSAQELRAESERVAMELIERFSQSPGALHIAARQYSELQQYRKAAAVWERCVELAPSYAGPRVGLAMAAMQQGDDLQAVAILEDALAAGCRSAELFLRLGEVLQKVGRLDSAESALRQGLQAYPDDLDLLVALGQVQLQRNELEDARDTLRQALRREPDSAMAHFTLATVAARLGREEEAAEHRARFEKLKADDPLAQYRFQVVYEAILRRIVVMTLAAAAAEYQRQEQPQDAERLYLRALELNPYHADTCRWLASFYHAQGRIGDAHLVQQRLVDLEPERAENYLNLASLSAQLGRHDLAERALRTAIRLAPDSHVAYRSLAALYLERGQVQEARQLAEQASRLAPSAEGYLLLAEACRRLGDRAGEESALRAARHLAPHLPPAPNASP